MSIFGPRFRRLCFVQTALWVMLPGFTLPLMAADGDAASEELAVAQLSTAKQDTYSINFNNVSIIEYIRFVSKISGSNFIFEENDLKFTVTIISEDQASLQDIFSALIQVLRINNLSLLEHDGNYVISRDPAVVQIPAVIAGTEEPLPSTPLPPIVTRVFRIKNTNVNSVAAIIRTMVSARALVSVSLETNQLIVSDITTNIEEIANLLNSLDAPHSPLEIDNYPAKFISPKTLATLAQPLLAPFTEGNPLILVPQEETKALFIVATPSLINRALRLLEDLDKVSQQASAENIFIYHPQYVSGENLLEGLRRIQDELKQSAHAPPALMTMLSSARFVRDSNSIIFIGDSSTYTKVTDLLATIDSVNSKLAQSSVMIYHLQYLDFAHLQESLATLAAKISSGPNPDQDLLNTLKTVTFLRDSNSVVFSGNAATLARLNQLLPTIDIPPASASTGYGTVFIYQLQNINDAQFQDALKQLITRLKASSAPDQNLIQALESAHYIKENNSVVFTGNDLALSRVRDMLPLIDTPSAASHQSTFIIYAPQRASVDDFKKAIDQFADNLKTAPNPDRALINALENGKYMSETRAFTFNGNPNTIAQLQQILPSLDVIPQSALRPGLPTSDQFYLYTPQYQKGEDLLKAIHEMAANFKSAGLADAALLHTLESAKWVPSSGAILFTGDSLSIERVKTLVSSVDTASLAKGPTESYYLYKLQYAEPQATLTYLESISSNLQNDRRQKQVQEVIKTIKIIKDNNALMLVGSKEGVDDVKNMIALYDTKDHALEAAPPGNFMIYKPKYLPPEQLIKDLKDLVADLTASGNVDPALQKAIHNLRYVESSQSVIISGTDATLAQVKSLLEEVDSPNAKGIYQLGAKTFFIYKLQYVSAQRLMQSLKTVGRDLAKGGLDDQALSSTIDSMQLIPETNSILFTGTPNALQKIQDLIGKFDIQALAEVNQSPELPIGFVIYRPKYKPGDELIEMICDFTRNLKQAGVNNQPLFNTADNMRWIETTCSLLITGDEASIKQVQELLHQFDIPSPVQSQIAEGIGETGFLVYKLQYHQGDDIQRALRRVATDLADSHRGQKMPIADAIEALQWIPVTNSLLTSGPPSVLSRVRELIQNLDVPLRQVFIEVLVLQTSLVNTQSFGLSWGGRAQYLNKLAGQTGNFQPPAVGDPLTPALLPLSGTVTPTPQAFGTPPGGFDLGVIGDIILHKGKTFFSLGSFVQAIELDNDATIVMNPKIIAQDSNNATMFFGFNVPFQGSLVTNITTSTVTTQSLEYRNVGHNLSITPTIGSGDIITLDINEDLSQVVGRTVGQIATSNNAIPGITTSQTTMATRVHVPDGHFVCLTGQVNESKTHTRQQIPCLGGLPLIGAAFANTSRTNDRENIIIFLRPQIIKTFDEYRTISEHQEDLFRTRAHMPVLKEAYDEGIDMVKTPENE